MPKLRFYIFADKYEYNAVLTFRVAQNALYNGGTAFTDALIIKRRRSYYLKRRRLIYALF